MGAFARLAHGQEIDLAVGGNTLWSPKNTTASTGFLPPPEKGGTYPGVSVQYILENHFGISLEGSFRYHQAIYEHYQPYRPILSDVNGVFTRKLQRKTVADMMAGLGVETLLFENDLGTCTVPAGGCRAYLNANHFMVHIGGGVRYYFWRELFIRPEAHWYYIPNNYEFHSNNVFRVGASVGYTFH